MGSRVYALTPENVVHSSDTSDKLLRRSERRAQRPPDSPFLVDGTQTLPLGQLSGTRPGSQSETNSLFKCFLGTTSATCSLLFTEAVPPTQTSDRTFDLYAPCDCLSTAKFPRLIAAGLSIGLPTGTTGRIEPSPHSKSPDSDPVTLGLLDSSTVERNTCSHSQHGLYKFPSSLRKCPRTIITHNKCSHY